MILISHRGNINGRIVERENSPDYILEAIKFGYHVEIDIWLIDKNYYLGHDEPIYKIDLNDYIEHFDKLWFHCKNIEALYFLSTSLIPIRFFWHQNDNYTLVIYSYGNNSKYIWTYPGQKLIYNSIAVLPETVSYTEKDLKVCSGICSDVIEKYSNL